MLQSSEKKRDYLLRLGYRQQREPYVESEDMDFDSRDISITGNIVSDSDSSLPLINDFMNELPGYLRCHANGEAGV